MDIRVEDPALLNAQGNITSIRIPIAFHPPEGDTHLMAEAKIIGARSRQTSGKVFSNVQFEDSISISADPAGRTLPTFPIEISSKHNDGRDILWFDIKLDGIPSDTNLVEMDIGLYFARGRLIDVTIPVYPKGNSPRIACGPLRRRRPSTIPLLNTLTLYMLLSVLLYWNARYNVDVHAAWLSEQQVACGIGAVFGFLSLPTLRSLKALTSIEGILSLIRFPELVFDRVYLRVVRSCWLLAANCLLSLGICYALWFGFSTVALPQAVPGEVLYDTLLTTDVTGKRLYAKDVGANRYFYYDGRSFNLTGERFEVATLTPKMGILERTATVFALSDSAGKGYAGTYKLGEPVDATKAQGDYPNTLIGDIYACMATKGLRVGRITFNKAAKEFVWTPRPKLEAWEVASYLRQFTGIAATVLSSHSDNNGKDYHYISVSRFTDLVTTIKRGAAQANAESDALSRISLGQIAVAIADDIRRVEKSTPREYTTHLYGEIALVEAVGGEKDVNNEAGQHIRSLMQAFKEGANAGFVAEDREIFLMFNSLILRLIRNSGSSDLLAEHTQYVNELLARPNKTGVDKVSDYLWTYLDVFESKGSDALVQVQAMKPFFKQRLAKLTNNSIWPEKRAELLKRFTTGYAQQFLLSILGDVPGYEVADVPAR